jgi:Mg-chelatase subunit ChlD
MIFTNPYWLLAALLVLPVIYVARRKERIRVATSRHYQSSLLSRLVSYLPVTLQALAVTLATVALCQPLVPVDEKHSSKVQGRDIILALDWSGSMAEPYKGDRKVNKRETWYHDATKPPVELDEGGKPKELRRIDAAQDALVAFAEARQKASAGDHIGLIAFDHKPLLRWPLDRDIKQITRHGSFLPKGKGPQELGVGTNFGNDMPGPIDLAADHFEAKGKSSTRVLILLTDGENEIKTDVMTRLSAVIRKARMKMYVVGVGEKIGSGELSLEQLCRSEGGEVFRAETQADLDKCFEKINALESSPIPVTQDKSFEPVFYYFLAAALALYVLANLSEAVILSR